MIYDKIKVALLHFYNWVCDLENSSRSFNKEKLYMWTVIIINKSYEVAMSSMLSLPVGRTNEQEEAIN